MGKKIKIKPSTIVRTIVYIITLLNQILAMTGACGLPVEADLVYRILSAVVSVCVGVWVWWKNNSFTKEAIISDELKDALKDGQITTEEADMLLHSADVLLYGEEPNEEDSDEE